mgnify:CR=1 FL=1
MTDTIFALATPPGRGAIAVVRLSGPGVESTLASLGAHRLKPRMASVRSLSHSGATIDQALVLRFVAPHSYTGEDAAELHLHGGRAVVEAASRALIALLFEHIKQPDFCLRWQWRPNDLAIWDNRCVLHRRDAFDPRARRLMHRTYVKGSRPVELPEAAQRPPHPRARLAA